MQNSASSKSDDDEKLVFDEAYDRFIVPLIKGREMESHSVRVKLPPEGTSIPPRVKAQAGACSNFVLALQDRFLIPDTNIKRITLNMVGSAMQHSIPVHALIENCPFCGAGVELHVEKWED